MPTCKFCGETKPLIRAHIIPRAFYTLLHGQDGPTRLISNVEGHWPQRSPQGIYDRNILCEECDNYFGRFDQHAAETLLATDTVTPLRDQNSIVGNMYDKADPQQIHRFVASVAWRASHSNHKFFNDVRLGQYEGLIKRFLQGDDQLETEIDIFIAEFDSNEVPFLNPHYTRFGEVLFLLIYASRFIFYLKTDPQPVPKDFAPLSIQNGARVVTIVRNWRESNERQVMKTIARQTPKPVGRR